jgi:hypothetical protein
VAAAGLALACGRAREQPAAIDHVLLVVVDTLRAEEDARKKRESDRREKDKREQ